MYDTHAHLNFPQLSDRIEEIVQKSQAAGVEGIIIASSNLGDSQKSLFLAQKYPGYLFASVGIHPQKTDPKNKMSIEEQLSSLERLITDNCSLITAVGETGLDFSEPPPGEEKRLISEQIELFKGQISLAQKHHLPLVVHARKSVDETIEILSAYKLKGVFHCYAGGRKRISKILSLPKDWYFGFDGNLTYDEGLQNTLKLIPPERILIETDSPFLTPAPYRGQINTPAYLPLIQKTVNRVFGQDLISQIAQNTLELFPLKY
jgi:TatD DNase family protein